MRVYKFLTCRYGLRAIRERRIKISQLGSINDPFELVPFDLSDPEIRRAMFSARQEFCRNRGLLCFSRHWRNPVLWAHYAESHRGLCLGFEVDDEAPRPIEYVDRPRPITTVDSQLAEAMLFTKYEDWRYEEEIRLWVDLDERSGDLYFHNLGPKLALMEIIVGAACTLTQRRIAQTLDGNRQGVRIVKARPAYNAFEIVEDDLGFTDGGNS